MYFNSVWHSGKCIKDGRGYRRERMDIIKERIKEKAKKRFIEEESKAESAIKENKILKNLLFRTEGGLSITMFSNTECFLSHHRDILKKHTNYYEIKERLLEQYEKEETDKLLNKIDSLKYFLDGSNV